MSAQSVVRQWSVIAIAAVFLLPLLLGVFWLLSPLLELSGSATLLLLVLGGFLVLLSLAVITACLVSITIRASVDAAGVASGEVGARWSYGWPEVAHVWLVRWREQVFLAVLPLPTAAPPRSRTSWRSRRFRLPEAARTVRVDPTRVAELAQAVQAHRGVPPESYGA